MTELKLSTKAPKQILDITDTVSRAVNGRDGVVFLHLLHTTAALTTADLDPGTDRDFLDFLEAIVPDIEWRHPHNPAHAPDHLLASLIGAELSVPLRGGKLQLGSWQRVVLVEFNGPRERTISISFLEGN